MPREFETGIRIKAVDRVTRVVDKINRRFDPLVRKVRKTANAFQALQMRTERFRKSMARMGSKMRSFGRTMSTYVTLPIAAFGAYVVKAGAQFETSMKRVGVLSGATGKAFAGLEKRARDLGATTQFSASQAAEAMGNLAIAGFDTEQIMQSIKPVLDLAGASQQEIAVTAENLAGTMRAFGFETNKAAEIADKLVAVMSSSNVKDPTEFIEAFKLAGPLAKAGLSFDQTATSLGLLANTMFKGSIGGTALKQALVALAKPSKDAIKQFKKLGIKKTDLLDSSGNLKSIRVLIEKLAPVADKTSVLIDIFGKRAGPAMAALISQGLPAFDKLNEAISNSAGKAAEVNAVYMEGASGAMAKFKSAFEALAIAIAKSGVLDLFTKIANKVAGFFQRLSEKNPSLLRLMSIVAGLAAAAGPLIIALGAIAAAIGALAGPVGLVVAGVVALGGLAAVIIAKWDKVSSFFSKIWNSPFGKLVRFTNVIGYMIEAAKFVIRHWEPVRDFFLSLYEAVKPLLRILEKFISASYSMRSLKWFFGFDGGKGYPLGPPVGAKETAQGVVSRENTNNASVRVDVNSPPATRVTADVDEGMDFELSHSLGVAGATP